MKGWFIFGATFLLGVLLIIAAIIYEILIGGAEDADLPPRILAICGLVVLFGSIYGAAGWRFHIWLRTREDHPSDRPPV